MGECILTKTMLKLCVTDLRDILKSYDRDESGYIDVDELGEILPCLGLMPTDDDLVFLKKHFDTNGNVFCHIVKPFRLVKLIFGRTHG